MIHIKRSALAIAAALCWAAAAQAGTFTLTPKLIPNTNPAEEVRDSEWGAGGAEPIWSTFPGGGQTGSGSCLHGQTTCVQGWDNATISYTGSSGDTFLIEYFGSGNSSQTNNFLWNTVSLFGASPPANAGCANNFAVPCKSTTVSAVVGDLPFAFTTNLPAGTQVDNGDEPTLNGSDVAGAHYFVSLTGKWADLTGNAVYLGFSDGNNNTTFSDDDAADYVVRISVVPEPGSLALAGLALAGLGFARRRKSA